LPEQVIVSVVFDVYVCMYCLSAAIMSESCKFACLLIAFSLQKRQHFGDLFSVESDMAPGNTSLESGYRNFAIRVYKSAAFPRWQHYLLSHEGCNVMA